MFEFLSTVIHLNELRLEISIHVSAKLYVPNKNKRKTIRHGLYTVNAQNTKCLFIKSIVSNLISCINSIFVFCDLNSKVYFNVHI